MDESEGKRDWVDWRLSEIERRLGYEHPPAARRTFEALDFSPRAILISITLLNIALFIGGTVYTGVQVKSIQERYEEASVKIADAKRKYDEAALNLQSIQVVADQAKASIGNIQKQTSDLLSDLQKRAKDNGNEIAAIKSQADQELDLVKKRGASTIARMNSYQEDAEAALAKAAKEVGLRIEKEIRVNTASIEAKQASIDGLGLRIEGLSAEVKKKDLEIATVRKGLEDQLDTAKALNVQFTSKVREIARTDKVTIPVAYSITDIWLKVVFFGVGVVSLVSFALAFRR